MRRRAAAALALVATLAAAPVAAAEGCDFLTADYLDEMRDIGAVEALEIRTHKYRKWVRNGLQIVTSRKRQIEARHKKTFAATIRIKYPFGVCEHRARFRQNGDWKDHIALLGGKLVSSLDVRMKTGSVAGVVRFKLFIPEVRNGANEILATELLRAFGYIAPRSRLMAVSHDDSRLWMLFQEKPAKELLEAHLRREGPIIEGEETVFWRFGLPGEKIGDLKPWALSRLTNGAWARRGAASATMSAAALAAAQGAWSEYAANDAIGVALRLPDPDGAYARYAALMLAMNGVHGLLPHNRKLYWNALRGVFEPIYYDGDIHQGPLTDQFFRADDWRAFAGLIPREATETVAAQLAAVDAAAFTARVSGFLSKGMEQALVEGWLATIGANLEEVERRLAPHRSEIAPPPPGAGVPPAYRAFYAQRFPAARFADVLGIGDELARLKICDAAGACEDRAVPLEELADLMEAEGIVAPDEQLIFAAAPPLPAAAESAVPVLNRTVRHAPDASVRWNEATRALDLVQSRPGDWFLISDGALDDVEIRLIGAPGAAATQGQRFNAQGLTGCVTFHNVAFAGSRIAAAGGGCEDSVNIVGGAGRIAFIDIDGAAADALDMDFADIVVNRIRVAGAGNDCVDVSTGTYRFGVITATGCGDKGLSVGEGSRVTVDRLTATGVAIAVSSKDGSSTRIEELISDAPLCLEAYSKKQEFAGARLSVGARACDGAEAADAGSVIEVGEGRM